ncbi:HAMP domain-containing protein [uncultured Jatrophihabitans sp.]|uniref:sensor histidine kinase n=1 Tax=uncultured Jatrophihabitans sp. TaxID=1610747 RepID=UPI0035CC04B6
MRRRILLLVVGMTVLVVLAFAIPLAALIRHQVYTDATQSLQRQTSDLAFYIRQRNAAPSAAALRKRIAEIGGDRAASVQLPDLTVIGTLPPGGRNALASTAETGDSSRSQQPGFPGGFGGGAGERGGPPVRLRSWYGGELSQLRVLPPGPFTGSTGTTTGVPRSNYLVTVYASDDALHSGEDGWFLLLAGASVGLLLLGVLAGELLTRRIVRPLVDTADTAQRLAAGDVTARAPTAGPTEVADVGRALNRLADRIDQLIAEERETVADLSHRLRTPLTALRLDAEALRDRDDAERVGAHVSALERMLTAVIRAARRPQREGRMPSCDADAVVRDRVMFWSALAEDQGRTGSSELPGQPVPVRAAAEDLAAAVDALLENVVAHTPEGTDFAVLLNPTPSGARLTVSDDGPGMAVDEPVRGRSDRGSTGLGLDIARRCAESSGGSMIIARSATGGAAVTLDLGAP